MIISPSSPITQTVAKINVFSNGLRCSFVEYSDVFRHAVKGLGMWWAEGCWERQLNAENGLPSDRAAELASTLLNAGFICDVDDEIALLAERGEWAPEQKRWVRFFDGKYHLRWYDKNENLYRCALMLPEACWDRSTKCVAVPALYFSEVIGFADEHNFEFTQIALDNLENAKRQYKRMILPNCPVPATKKNVRKQDTLNLAEFRDIPERVIVTKTSLLPHQIPAVEKILPMTVGAFFMEMGTGKTRCAIELVVKRQKRLSRVIWFTPVSLKSTVAAEIEKHTIGESVHIFDDKHEIPPAFWYIVGIETMSSSDWAVLAVNDLIDNDTFVIVDESSYIKGAVSKRSMRIAELSAKARYRLLLTGTPISQGVVDLYAQMRFLSQKILGYHSFYSFARQHLEYSTKYPGMIVQGRGIGKLADKISPFVYQVTKDDCLNLPEKLYDSFYFRLTDAQLQAYQQAKNEIIDGILDEIPDYIIFQLFTALQQIVSGWWNRNGKEFISFPHRRIETLQTAIDSIPATEKVIIWCKYVDSIHEIARTLADCALYYGDLNEKQRDEQLQLFRGEKRFFVATMATGGHGLTLNEAHYHIFYENDFKYSHRIQAEDRSHRIGQTHHVTYIDIVSHSGIDKRIQDAIAKKENVVRSFQDEVNQLKVNEL